MVDGAIVEKEDKILIKEYHEEIGHPNFSLTRATAKAQNIKLEGPLKPCSACGISKAKKAHIQIGHKTTC